MQSSVEFRVELRVEFRVECCFVTINILIPEATKTGKEAATAEHPRPEGGQLEYTQHV